MQHENMQHVFDTSNLAKMADLASFKSEVEKLHVDKSKATLVDFE